MIGELPSEIVDPTLMITTDPCWYGGDPGAQCTRSPRCGGTKYPDRVNVPYDKGGQMTIPVPKCIWMAL